MSYTAKELLKLASDYDNVATRALVVTAAKKEKKKLDPKAKVRNRGTVCVPAESAKDKKDHFPINNEAQARNALARVNQFSKVPEWYSGSLQGLVSLVARKVHSKYPGITVSKDAKKPGKKKASEYYDTLLNKFAQGAVKDQAYAKNLTDSRIQSINAINTRQLTPDQVKEYANGYLQQAFNDFQGNMITQEQYTQIVQAGQAKMQQNAPASTNQTTAPAAGQATPARPAASTAPSIARKPLPRINSDVQRALNDLGFQGKDFKPLDPDGARGPNTDFALASFKSSAKWKNLLNIQPTATPEELSGLVMQAKQMKDAGTDKEAPTDFTKGPTMGQPPAGGIVRESPF